MELEHEEIDITPEMIEAGIIELTCWNQQEDRYGDIVVSIFEAMMRAKLRNLSGRDE
jgi:hypothetical protein